MHFYITAQGVLIGTEHFITLDGRHFTFKGTCAYVLLQDVVDGNFSVAINHASKSIIVSDQHDSVEFFDDSTVSILYNSGKKHCTAQLLHSILNSHDYCVVHSYVFVFFIFYSSLPMDNLKNIHLHQETL